MSKIKLLSTAVIALLLINFLLIGFMVFNKKGRPNHEGPRNIIIEKLAFSDQQIAAYDGMIQQHRAAIRKKDDDILLLKSKLYTNIITNANSKDSLIIALGKLQMDIENIHYKHFEDIKNICNQNQMLAFENLTKELGELFNRKPKKDNRQ